MKTTRKKVSDTSAPVMSDRWAWGLLLISLLIVTVLRIRLLPMPLERDEGEFAYMGQLILDGIPPYKIAYNMKLPGVYLAYAAIMAIFGQTIIGIHIGFMLVCLVSMVLLFLLGKRLVDPLVGVIAAAGFGLSSLSMSILGASAHAMYFVMTFLLGGMILMLKGLKSGNTRAFFWVGLLLGTGFLMKQHAFVFVPFAALYILWDKLRSRPIPWTALLKAEGLLLTGSAIPFGLTCLILYKLGVFKAFWFWTFTYAREYISEEPAAAIWPIFFGQIHEITGPFVGLWLLGAIGLILLFVDDRLKEKRVFLAGFTVFSFLAACPGFYFRHHYFIPFLSAIGLLVGVSVSSSGRLLLQRESPGFVRGLPPILLIAALLYGIGANWVYFFKLGPADASHRRYGSNPFPEMVEVAKYLKAHTGKDDVIAVLGSEPELFFYAHRRSASGFIYTYGLMEQQKYASQMQKEMIREIETAQPKYVVFVSCSASWLTRPESDKTIFKWAGRYVGKHYEPAGVVDYVAKDYIVFSWDEEARDRGPVGTDFIIVFQRKD